MKRPTARPPKTRGLPSPLVEAITKHKGDDWEVNNAEHGRTDNAGHRMYVPLGDDICRCGDTHSDATRAHELVHSKISPERPAPTKVKVGKETIEVSKDNIEAAEERRVNHSVALMEGDKLSNLTACHLTIDSMVNGLMDNAKYEDIVRLSIMGQNTNDLVIQALEDYQDSVEDVAEKSPQESVKAAAGKKIKVIQSLISAIPYYGMVASRTMSKSGPHKLPNWKRTEYLAAYLEVNLGHLQEQIAQALASDPEPDFAEVPYLNPYTPPEGKPLREVKEAKDGSFTMAETGPKDGKPQWGKNFAIETAKMVRSLAPWKLQKANRAIEEGTVPRYMHRWVSDKKVFHKIKRLEGGSVLIDASGSMDLETEDIDAMVEVLPAVTIAIYCGPDGPPDEGGIIRIVAQNGKRTDEEGLDLDEYPRGNGIDGPALEWLGTQTYPRIWITDGYVTSPYMDHGQTLIEDVKRLCRLHKITVAPDVETAVHILKTGRVAR